MARKKNEHEDASTNTARDTGPRPGVLAAELPTEWIDAATGHR